jgi:hypothetical protein
MDGLDFSKLNKLVNPTSMLALENAIFNFSFPQDIIDSELKRITDVVNTPFYKDFYYQNKFFNNIADFDNIVNTAKLAAELNTKIAFSTEYASKLTEMQSFINNLTYAIPVIDNLNTAWSAFNNSGIFNAISDISKIMPAYQAVERINKLFPYVDTVDCDVTISDDDTISVDGETLSANEVIEITQEFTSFPLDSPVIEKEIVKIKSKKGKIWLIILWFILYDICLAPLFQDTYSVIRKYTGIEKLLEKIDIKNWVDNFVKDHFSVISDEKE